MEFDERFSEDVTQVAYEFFQETNERREEVRDLYAEYLRLFGEKEPTKTISSQRRVNLRSALREIFKKEFLKVKNDLRRWDRHKDIPYFIPVTLDAGLDTIDWKEIADAIVGDIENA